MTASVAPSALHRRFRRKHITEAYLEVSAVRSEVRREATEEQAAVEPDILSRTDRGDFARFRCVPGARIGTFELVEIVGRTRQRRLVWRLLCECGAEAIRIGANLVRHAREGREPTCRRCLSERRQGFLDFQRDVYRDAWRRQWVDYRTLWTADQTRSLCRHVRDDLEQALGEVPEVAPSLKHGYIETDPAYACPPGSPESFFEDAWRTGGFWDSELVDRIGASLPASALRLALERGLRRRKLLPVDSR